MATRCRDAAIPSLYPPLRSLPARYNPPGLSPVPSVTRLALAGVRAVVDHANVHPLSIARKLIVASLCFVFLLCARPLTVSLPQPEQRASGDVDCHERRSLCRTFGLFLPNGAVRHMHLKLFSSLTSNHCCPLPCPLPSHDPLIFG